MSSARGGYGGIAIVLLLAVVGLAVLFLAASAAPAVSNGPAGLLARPPVLTGANIPNQYRLHLGPSVALTDLGPTPATASPPGPGPEPTDLPFGTNVAIWTDARPQTRPTMAADSTGRVFVAFQHEVSGTNRDIYVSWTDDGGRTWMTPIAVAATGADETNPNVVVTAGDRVTIFFQQNANLGAFAYAASTDRGVTWTPATIGTGATLTNHQFPSFVKNPGGPTPGAGVYGGYQIFCTDAANCGGGAWTLLMLFNDDVSNTGGWQGTYFAQTPDVELFHPSVGINSGNGDLVGGMEIEITDNLEYDLTWFRFNPTSGFFSQDGLMCGNFCPSPDFVWPSISVDGTRIVVGADFNNAAIAPSYIILAVYSTNGGANYQLVNANSGTIDAQFVDQKYVFFRLQGTQISTAYWKAGATWYVSSLNAGAAFGTAQRVSDNTPPTAIDQLHAVALVNSTLGPLLTWHDSRDGNPNIYFAALQRYTVTLATTPPTTLNVRFDLSATWSAAPYSQSFPAGSSHSIEAQSPQSPGAGIQYVFVQWNDGNTQNPRTISVTADITYTAQFKTQYQLTVATNPAGRNVNVSGAPQVGPYTTWCDAASSVPVDAPSPQTVTATSRYRFTTWSDGGAASHSITCDAAKTVTANFVLQFLVNVRTNAPGNPTLQVTVNSVTYTAPVSFWFDQNSGQSLLAISPQALSADTQVVFTDWQGGPPNVAWTVAITGATDYVANYKVQYRVILDTNPPGLQLVVEGIQGTAPITSWWDAGTSHSVIANSPQFSGTTTRYQFSAWSDGDVNPSRSITADTPKTVIAIFQTQYFLTMTASPTVGTLSPGNGWHNAGEPVTIQATAPADTLSERYRFNSWTGDATGSVNPTTITMDAPKSVTANWFHQFRIDIQVASGGPSASVVIDGGAGLPMPQVVWWNEGTSHTIAADANILVGTDTRWNFVAWSPGGATNPLTVAASSSGTYSASYSRQFRVTIVVDATVPSGATAPDVLVGGNPYTAAIWADEGSQLALNAQDSQSGGTGIRYKFTSWSDTTTGAIRTYSVTAPAALTVTYETQFRLTVTSSYGSPVCVGAKEQSADQCWYADGATATVTVTSPSTAGGQNYVIESWSGDASGVAASVTISMSGPKAVTVNWRPVTFLEAYGVVLGIVIAILAIAIILALLLMRRRKKQEPEAVPPPPPATAGTKAPPAQGGTKTCGACGMEIPAGAATCPVCGAPA